MKLRDGNVYRHGYYGVYHNGEIIVGGNKTLSLCWLPSEGYYFRNYWYALAYSMRLKNQK